MKGVSPSLSSSLNRGRISESPRCEEVEVPVPGGAQPLHRVAAWGWWARPVCGDQISALVKDFVFLPEHFLSSTPLNDEALLSKFGYLGGFLVFDTICIIIYFLKMLVLEVVTYFSVNII